MFSNKSCIWQTQRQLFRACAVVQTELGGETIRDNKDLQKSSEKYETARTNNETMPLLTM